MKKVLIFLLIMAFVPLNFLTVSAALPAPPSTWQEHWFEHNQVVKLVYYNDDVAVYLDDDLNRNNVAWVNTHVTNVWRYVKQTYGPMGGDGRLYVILHNKYPGGHPAYYFDGGHDYRNVIDVGGSDFVSQTGWNLGAITHEIGHIVESATKGTRGSPAFDIWKDSKWCEIFNYDVYTGLGMTGEAQNAYNDYISGTDSFPREGTAWFKNWFYPIWNNYGRATVLNNYFTLLSEYYPKNSSGSYTRSMNMGEFVYFWSGAAGQDLKSLATTAFGWTTEYENQYQQAKSEFPAVVNASKPYFMLVNKNSGKALDLIGGNQANGARINQWSYDYNSPNQRWAIEPAGNGHFKIISYVTGKAACVAGPSLDDRAQIHDWDYTGVGTDQQWDFIDAGNGWYKIKNVYSGKLMEVSGSSLDNDGKVQQYTDNGTATQLWRIQPWGDYYIKADSGKYVCVQGCGSSNGDKIIQYQFEPNPWFKWRFENVGDGWYKVSSLNALSKVLCVSNASYDAAAGLHLWEYNPPNIGDQKVRIVPRPNGKFKFYFAHDGQTWDVPGGATGNDVQITQYPDNSNPWQGFALERVP